MMYDNGHETGFSGGPIWVLHRRDPLFPFPSRAKPLSLSVLGGKQLPVPLGDDFDRPVGHFDGGLIVNRVHRNW
jgi:hypothetical protein